MTPSSTTMGRRSVALLLGVPRLRLRCRERTGSGTVWGGTGSCERG